MTKYFPQLYDRLVAASTGGGAAVSDELSDTPTSRYLLANTGGVEHPSNCPAQCVKVRAAGRCVRGELRGHHQLLFQLRPSHDGGVG